MNLIKDLINKHKEVIIESVFTDELQAKVVKKLNDNIDVPFISEKTEAKHLNAAYDSIEDVIKGALRELL